MLHRYSVLGACALLLTAASLPTFAQAPIVIDRNDMPNTGDSLRVSQTLILRGPALTQTGANQTWNYSSLQPLNQSVSYFSGVNATPGVLPIVFGVLGGVNRATIANRQPLPSVLVQAGLPISEVYSFFNESASNYRQVGYGAEIPTVGAIPVFYRSQSLQDVIYRFPLAYEQRDSSNSDFSVDALGQAYVRQKQKRVNNADGWGTLTTPFGTFATLRVVSTLQTRDSISVQGQPGIAVQRPEVKQYKWLGKEQGIPLLEVTTQLVNGREVVSLVQYRDIYRRLPILSNQTQLPESAVAVYPNPVGASESLRLTLPAAGSVSLTATDLAGRVLFKYTLPHAARETVVPASAFGEFRGVALLRVQTETGVAVRRVVRE
ncbi:T9SS type A sorting domain-containing protein [Hymenobacter tibetensis]|uniref:T9SS type A sorting domain-containing protein n=1 Tax=Hymenobacter tibetensis TaxID=497967 RepID=A0ABY4CUV9_9BACT|nr:T9SS type A sorting domain-containing protein [Hymenobacter tibetensis]UOG73822.1 T9SS type A sorting domain-containing protein [Hymenobacter tibetensis]